MVEAGQNALFLERHKGLSDALREHPVMAPWVSQAKAAVGP